jgi:hypothetical protein
MRETEAELGELQRLLDDSARSAGPFLAETFQIPERTPRAGDLVAPPVTFGRVE